LSQYYFYFFLDSFSFQIAKHDDDEYPGTDHVDSTGVNIRQKKIAVSGHPSALNVASKKTIHTSRSPLLSSDDDVSSGGVHKESSLFKTNQNLTKKTAVPGHASTFNVASKTTVHTNRPSLLSSYDDESIGGVHVDSSLVKMHHNLTKKTAVPGHSSALNVMSKTYIHSIFDDELLSPSSIRNNNVIKLSIHDTDGLAYDDSSDTEDSAMSSNVKTRFSK